MESKTTKENTKNKDNNLSKIKIGLITHLVINLLISTSY